MENNLEKIRLYLKKKGIPVSYLVEYMGYSRSHISSVLNENKPCTIKFYRLLLLCIFNLYPEEAEEVKNILLKN